MKKLLLSICLFLILLYLAKPALAQRSLLYAVKTQQNGVLLTQGDQKLSVAFINPSVVRVRFAPKGKFEDNSTSVCLPQQFKPVSLNIKQAAEAVTIQSSSLRIVISKRSGSIRYFNLSGEVLLAENPDLPREAKEIELSKTTFDDAGSKIEKTANGDQASANIAQKASIGTAWKVRQQFIWQTNEALYGLGSHQEDYMNLRGTRQYLYEYNLKKSMPVLMSTQGYGLLFDAGSAMEFHDDTVGSFMDVAAVHQLDYYFMFGPEFDQIIHQFRSLTGKVELPPKYAFGYIQSKERYTQMHDIDSVVQRFRTNKIPLDMIVQDWLYWKDGLWGYKKFDETKFPDPAGMIQRVHQQNSHFMLSIWPQLAAEEETEMSSKGYVLGRRIYDVFNPAARQMYWQSYVNKNLFSKGVDAWWCDSTEPVEFDWNRGANNIANNPSARFEKNVKVMADLLGELRVNTYSLHHTMGIYENQRKTGDPKRVFILTRASYPGMQRYGTMVWNGDTKATWEDFKSWIPGGLNYMVTGSPYWTIDAGAFFVRPRAEWFSKGNFPEGTKDLGYREFYVRNLQYAAWLPLFRSHGSDFAREPWQFGEPGDQFYDAILKQINLRYRLLPYIYSVAALVTNQDQSMTRSLLFDYRKDKQVYDIKDEFLFSKAFLICPVTRPMYYGPKSTAATDTLKSRTVYLPAAPAWFDFWTGKRYQGGQTIKADAPIDHIPVFVKAGSVVPMGPVLQYAAEKPNAPWEIRVYPGSNGSFTIYEDEGETYNYQKGKAASYTINWNDNQHRVTIGARQGSFSEMTKKRILKLVLVKPGFGTGLEDYNGKEIEYDGKAISVSL